MRNAWVLFLLAGLFLVIWFCPISIPNILGITLTSSAIEVLSVIVGSLAAMLGITFAVMVVAFEIMQRTYATLAVRRFLRDGGARDLLFFYTGTMAVASFSLARLDDPLSTTNVNLVYLSLCLFIVSLSILYPYSRSVVTRTRSEKEIGSLAEGITFADISSLGTRRYISQTDIISTAEGNPVFLLSEMVMRTVKEGDRFTPRLVLDKSVRRLLTLLQQADGKTDRRSLINVFLVIIKSASREAVIQKQESTCEAVLDAIEQIHSTCAVMRLPWSDVIELNYALEELLEQAILSGMDETTIRGFQTIRQILRQHLMSNVPPEDEIWSLHAGQNASSQVPVDHDKALQWHDVSSTYASMLARLMQKGIEAQRLQLIGSGLQCLFMIASDVLEQPLGNLQKADIIRRCYEHAEFLTLKCADGGLCERIALSFYFFEIQIGDALRRKAEFSTIPLRIVARTQLGLAQRNALDPMFLNILGTVGRGLVADIEENSGFVEALLFITEVFDKTREILGQREASERYKQLYIELYRQVESLQSWMHSKEKTNERLQKQILAVLQRFDKLTSFREDFERLSVKWPTSTS